MSLLSYSSNLSILKNAKLGATDTSDQTLPLPAMLKTLLLIDFTMKTINKAAAHVLEIAKMVIINELEAKKEMEALEAMEKWSMEVD